MKSKAQYVLADNQLDHWLGRRGADYNRKRLILPTALHTIQDWYTQRPGNRSFDMLRHAFDRNWIRLQARKQGVTEACGDLKKMVLAHLYSELADRDQPEWPIILFESKVVNSAMLRARLSMILQVMTMEESTLVLRKYVMGECEWRGELFYHMAAVFCQEAFGRLPDRIQLFHLESGVRQEWKPNVKQLHAPADYLRLIHGAFLEDHCCPDCARARRSKRLVH